MRIIIQFEWGDETASGVTTYPLEYESPQKAQADFINAVEAADECGNFTFAGREYSLYNFNDGYIPNFYTVDEWFRIFLDD